MCMGSLKKFMNETKPGKSYGGYYLMVENDNLCLLCERQRRDPLKQARAALIKTEHSFKLLVIDTSALGFSWYIYLIRIIYWLLIHQYLHFSWHHICEGPSQPALFTWCWQVTWRIQVFIALYRPHTSSVKLSENTAKDPNCSLNSQSRLWNEFAVDSSVLWSWEVGRADHLPYLQSLLINFTYKKGGVIPPKQRLQACTAAVLRVKSTWSLLLPAQFLCIPAAAFGSAGGAEPVGDSKWQRSAQRRCDICCALGVKCDRVITLQGTALPAALAAMTQILLPKHRCAGNAPGPNREGFLVCTSQILLLLVW